MSGKHFIRRTVYFAALAAILQTGAMAQFTPNGNDLYHDIGDVSIGTQNTYGRLFVEQAEELDPSMAVWTTSKTSTTVTLEALQMGLGPAAMFSTNSEENTQPVLWALGIAGPSAYFNKEVGIGLKEPGEMLHIQALTADFFEGAVIEGRETSGSHTGLEVRTDGSFRGALIWDPDANELVMTTQGNLSAGLGVAVDDNDDVHLRPLTQTTAWGRLEATGRILTPFLDHNGTLQINNLTNQPVRIGDVLRIDRVPVWDGPSSMDVTWHQGGSGSTHDRISREGSSQRYKTNIEPFDEEFAKILNAQTMQYNMKDGYGDPDWLNFGLIAEELDELDLKPLVIYDSLGQPDGVRYKKISLYLLEVVKDQQLRIEALEGGSKRSTMPAAGASDALRRIEALEAQVDLLLNSQSAAVFEAPLESADNTSEVTAEVDVLGETAGPLAHAAGSPATLPTRYELSHNYPNPFNPETAIEYALPEAATVRLTIFDVLGRLIKSAANGAQTAGYHKYIWDGTDQVGNAVASGTYLYQLQAGEVLLTRKMTLTR